MGQALIDQLPDGVLRRSAEQRLNAALRGLSDHPARNKVKTPSLRLSSMRQRAVTCSMPKPMQLSSNTGTARMALAKGLRRRQAGE